MTKNMAVYPGIGREQEERKELRKKKDCRKKEAIAGFSSTDPYKTEMMSEKADH
jgi:hypothetical protein